MPKPIFIIGLPETSGMDRDAIQKDLSQKFDDYYIIMYPTGDYKPSFQVFYEKDFNEVKYEELKQLVLDAIKT